MVSDRRCLYTFFFEVKYDENGFQTVLPEDSDYKRVIRSIIGDLDVAPFPDAPVIPYGRPVHDRLRLEISRGCRGVVDSVRQG